MFGFSDPSAAAEAPAIASAAAGRDSNENTTAATIASRPNPIAAPGCSGSLMSASRTTNASSRPAAAITMLRVSRNSTTPVSRIEPSQSARLTSRAPSVVNGTPSRSSRPPTNTYSPGPYWL